MKNLILFFCNLILFVSTSLAQTFEWAFANAYYEFNRDNSVSTDAEGNIYVTTRCYSYSNSGPQYVSGVVISKFDSDGKLMWADTAIGLYSVKSVADDQGNVYLTGTAWGDIKLGSNTHYSNSNCGYLAKYTNKGHCEWAKFFPEAYPVHIATNNKTGGGYIIGRGKSYEGHVFTSEYNYNGNHNFLISYNSNGLTRWIKTVDFPSWGGVQTGTNVYQTNNSLFSDKSGTLYLGVTGIIEGVRYTYLQNLSENGETQTLYKFTSSTHPSAFCVSPNNSSYYTYYGGHYREGITINGIHYPPQSMHTNSFLVKMNNSGAVEWVKEIKGEPRIEYRDIKADSEGNFYVTGFFAGKADFDGVILNGTFENGLEGFIVKYNKNGEAIWAKKQKALIQYEGHVIPEVICLDEERGALYQAGNLRMECRFDDIVVNNDAYQTMFLAKLDLNKVTSIEKTKETGNLFNLYPNPARNQLNLHYQPKKSSSNLNFQIFNSTGQLVYSSSLTASENISQSIDIRSFSSGVYFVNLIDGEERVSRKFVMSR
jgi:hypothetical protein